MMNREEQLKPEQSKCIQSTYWTIYHLQMWQSEVHSASFSLWNEHIWICKTRKKKLLGDENFPELWWRQIQSTSECATNGWSFISSHRCQEAAVNRVVEALEAGLNKLKFWFRNRSLMTASIHQTAVFMHVHVTHMSVWTFGKTGTICCLFEAGENVHLWGVSFRVLTELTAQPPSNPWLC